MSDLASLLNGLNADGTIRNLAIDPLAQFGTRARPLLGAELLPERTVPLNAYREEGIEYRTILANDGTRYSPTQIKDGARIGSFLVELADIDIASEFTAQMHDTIVTLLNTNQSLEAAAQVTDWLNTTVPMSLREKMELQRWQAVADANVVRTSDNGLLENVAYPNPAGHRVTIASGTTGAPTGWYDPTHDPIADIIAQADYLKNVKGYTVSRIVTSRKLASLLGNHPKVQQRAGKVAFAANGSGVLGTIPGRVTVPELSALLAAEGIATASGVETYDLQARTSTGMVRFLRDTAFVMLAETGRDVTLDLGDNAPIVLSNTLGYTAIGRAAGEAAPGVAINTGVMDKKPKGLWAEGYATELPVILSPEGIAVLNIPQPS